MLKHDGILSAEELKEVLPPQQRLEKGPVAIIECIQDIPCDPCVFACPQKAISMKEGITDRPKLDAEKCNGCTLCVAACPGLAIFVVNFAHSKEHATIAMPYEMLPVPKEGDIVTTLDRSGKVVGKGKVLKVLKNKKFDNTYVVTIEIPKELAMEVRSFKCC